MKPKPPISHPSLSLFQSELCQILDSRHSLVKLSQKIDWKHLEQLFGALYEPKQGRPALPTRLMVGLTLLKYTYNESDQSVCDKWLENPYWQYFCGEKYMVHRLPLDPSSLTRWRKRMGEDKLEELLKQTLWVAKREGYVKQRELRRVVADTTVQEKNVTYPTDSKLWHRAREVLVRWAQAYGVKLRQSYARKSQEAYWQAGRTRRARKTFLAKKEEKKLRNYLGRVLRDIQHKMSKEMRENKKFIDTLEVCKKVVEQTRFSKDKVYSIHAPEVECIAKGKSHKRYEFGCKVSVLSTAKQGWILSSQAVHGRPHDSRTLLASLEQAERLTQTRAERVYTDRGYPKAKVPEGVSHHMPGFGRRVEGRTRAERTGMRQRNAIEAVISHLKQEHRMGRNYLKGRAGDRINALLAGVGYNFRKLMRLFLSFLRLLQEQGEPKTSPESFGTLRSALFSLFQLFLPPKKYTFSAATK